MAPARESGSPRLTSNGGTARRHDRLTGRRSVSREPAANQMDRSAHLFGPSDTRPSQPLSRSDEVSVAGAQDGCTTMPQAR
jgi:hypothetical protein